jgi:hypothetical protein
MLGDPGWVMSKFEMIRVPSFLSGVYLLIAQLIPLH